MQETGRGCSYSAGGRLRHVMTIMACTSQLDIAINASLKTSEHLLSYLSSFTEHLCKPHSYNLAVFGPAEPCITPSSPHTHVSSRPLGFAQQHVQHPVCRFTRIYFKPSHNLFHTSCKSVWHKSELKSSSDHFFPPTGFCVCS